MATTKEEQVFVPLPADQAFQRAFASVQGMGWTVTSADPNGGVVEATTGASLNSWGERVTVRVQPADGGTNVHISSAARLKTNITARGRNRKNVEAIAAKLQG